MSTQSGSSAQRIRIGLTGLAVAFLLVLLGSAISQSSRDPADNAAIAEAEAKAGPSEPMAELGVAPGGDGNTTAANTIAPKPPAK